MLILLKSHDILPSLGCSETGNFQRKKFAKLVQHLGETNLSLVIHDARDKKKVLEILKKAYVLKGKQNYFSKYGIKFFKKNQNQKSSLNISSRKWCQFKNKVKQ